MSADQIGDRSGATRGETGGQSGEIRGETGGRSGATHAPSGSTHEGCAENPSSCTQWAARVAQCRVVIGARAADTMCQAVRCVPRRIVLRGMSRRTCSRWPERCARCLCVALVWSVRSVCWLWTIGPDSLSGGAPSAARPPESNPKVPVCPGARKGEGVFCAARQSLLCIFLLSKGLVLHLRSKRRAASRPTATIWTPRALMISSEVPSLY